MLQKLAKNWNRLYEKGKNRKAEEIKANIYSNWTEFKPNENKFYNIVNAYKHLACRLLCMSDQSGENEYARSLEPYGEQQQKGKKTTLVVIFVNNLAWMACFSVDCHDFVSHRFCFYLLCMCVEYACCCAVFIFQFVVVSVILLFIGRISPRSTLYVSYSKTKIDYV